MATIDMGLKEGWGAVPLSRSAGNPSNTMWPAPMSTSVPSGVFMSRATYFRPDAEQPWHLNFCRLESMDTSDRAT